MSESEKSFSSRLDQLVARGSQADIAAKAGVSIRTLQRWIKCERIPSIDEAKALALAVERTPSWLAFGDDAAAPTEQERDLLDLLRRLPQEQREAIEMLGAKLAGQTIFRLRGQPEMRIVLPSTRVNLPRFPLSFVSRENFWPVRQIEDLAAGYGVTDGFTPLKDAFVPGVPRRGYTVAKIHGDSMLSTLMDGDHVLLKDFEPPYELPRIEAPAMKTSLSEWKGATGMQDGEIVVVNIPEYGPTLKRVHYDVSRGEANWKMQIVADNPTAWRQAFQIELGDTVMFYAKLMGLCEKV